MRFSGLEVLIIISVTSIIAFFAGALFEDFYRKRNLKKNKRIIKQNHENENEDEEEAANWWKDGKESPFGEPW